ncbi:hypothetical protein M527_20095 [Sphingobium indicum IP26]|nr:hypothetical protein M527_20095 [Sphingobium indicum IP26]
MKGRETAASWSFFLFAVERFTPKFTVYARACLGARMRGEAIGRTFQRATWDRLAGVE